jgi:lipoate-protein ligase A
MKIDNDSNSKNVTTTTSFQSALSHPPLSNSCFNPLKSEAHRLTPSPLFALRSVCFPQLSIPELLQKEEESFTLKEDCCIIVESTFPAIVLGVANKKELYVKDYAIIPIYRRRSGGGTVFVDENSILVSFIIKSIPLKFPEEILSWVFNFYTTTLNHPLFSLKERDFTMDNRKCGGNALYVKKNGWLLHTSFLWDFNPANMDKYLLMPPQMPQYRENRSHAQFLCSLKDYFPSKQEFIRRIKNNLFFNNFICRNQS